MFNDHKLSERQSKIIELIALNYSNKKIAEKLYISESTVKSDIKAIVTELNAYGRVHASVLAYKRKIFKL